MWGLLKVDIKPEPTYKNEKELCLCKMERLVNSDEVLANYYPEGSAEYDWAKFFIKGYDHAVTGQDCLIFAGEPFKRGFNSYWKKGVR